MSRDRWMRNLANKNPDYYIRGTLTLQIEILQPKKHETYTTEWLQAEINKFKDLIHEEGGLVRVYHCV